MPGRKTFLHLKARYSSSRARHTTYQSYTSTDPLQHPSPPQKNHPRADLRACMPSAAGRGGGRRLMASTAQRFRSFYKLFPPAQPRAEVPLRRASVGLGLGWHGTAALPAAQDRAEQQELPGVGKQAAICATAAGGNQQCLELYVHVAKERALRSLLSKEGQSQD